MTTLYHWHIVYRSESGHKVIDSVPFGSKDACENMIRHLNWAKYEHPKAVRLGLCHCGRNQ